MSSPFRPYFGCGQRFEYKVDFGAEDGRRPVSLSDKAFLLVAVTTFQQGGPAAKKANPPVFWQGPTFQRYDCIGTMALVYFITHPDVEIDPSVPVPEWRLSPMGLARMRTFSQQPRLSNIGWIYSSSERKAMDGASILSAALGVPNTVREALGENDRSATGYLARAEFEETAKRFFSSPRASIRGWERAIDAQKRIVEALDEIREHNNGAHDVAVVSHGGVGALLLCHIKQIEITPEENQPGTTGGNYFIFDQKSRRLMMDWQSID